MATFLLVPGAWHGGWCWKKLAPHLRAAGHEVYAPSLTGLGERSHLLSPGIDLGTHVQDILALLFFDDLQDVIIVGHSYGAMLIPMVLERAAGRIIHAVFLDAPVPAPGQSLFDILADARIGLTTRANRVGEGWNVPPFESDYGITDREDQEWVMARLTPHPLATFQQPAQFSRAPSSIVPCTFIACQWALQTYGAMPPQAEGMRYVELPTAHAAMITAPRELAGVLLGLR
ncbi:MAG TPA: alpha/beta fold hydrolase [Anaerolineae bacterium]|nr:alpha/beta fold hydrolase [Anaerolineae bacterium]